MRSYQHFYIDGRWQSPSGADAIDIRSAATEDVIGRVPRGTPEDIDRAVEAARRAFEGPWSQNGQADRSKWLEKLATALERRVPDVASTITGEVGMPIRMSTAIQAQLPVKVVKDLADLAGRIDLQEQIGNSLVVREPFGVVGMITPWNYPLHQMIAKVAPAIAAGCTMVLKPSEVAPLTSYVLAETALEIGLPPGVLNIVHGEGSLVGEAIARHPGIDMVSFTGSIPIGQRVSVLAAETVKKVTLELGGKSACIVLDDAPIEKAVTRGVNNAMLNSGQTCSAWTRMIVPRRQLDRVLETATAAVGALTLGDPFDPAVKLGPLVSETQRRRVELCIRQGIDEGARVVAGGGRPAAFTRGHYVEPTIFADVRPGMTIAQQEIFGPVLAILTYETEDEAIAIANGTIYGLAAGVWSADSERALRVARRLHAGQVDVNGGRFNSLAPFGGYKRSGVGRELGRCGLEEYFQVKSIQC